MRRPLLIMRTIEHTSLVHRSYGDIAWLLDRHGEEILEQVAGSAVRRSAAIHDAAERPLPGFDSTHTIALVVAPIVFHHHHATLEFSWEGNATKRLLVSADVRIDIKPLVRRGPRATTEVILRADYDPPTTSRRSPEQVLFGRRLVKAALKELLDALVARLEEYEETPISR